MTRWMWCPNCNKVVDEFEERCFYCERPNDMFYNKDTLVQPEEGEGHDQ